MGGYYSEPNSSSDSQEDQSQTQMVFGVRCLEFRVNDLPLISDDDGSLVVLQPTTAGDGSSVANTANLARYLLGGNGAMIQEKTVLELGSGIVSLALARGGAARVLVCHEDETRLRIAEHAHCFWNDPSEGCNFDLGKC